MLRRLSQFWFQILRSSSFHSKLALVLVWLLCSHWLLCTANSNVFRCGANHAIEAATGEPGLGESEIVLAGSHTPEDRHDDVCCAGTDETHVLTAFVSFRAPSFQVTLVIWALLLLMLLPLAPGAAVMRGRDDPADVPYPALEIIRACLPHRAPPVFFA